MAFNNQLEEVFSIAIDAFHASALECAYADNKLSFRQVLNWINNEYTPQEINQEIGFFIGLTPHQQKNWQKILKCKLVMSKV